MMSQKVADVVNYDTLYPKCWKSPIFNHPRSFWDDSYGIPLDSHPAGKIVVFGFPKSGNVWLKSLLVDYFKLPPIEPLFDVEKPGVGITHRPFDEHIGMRADFLRGVCIVRDLRDVIASYYKYTQTNRFRSARPEFHFDNERSFYFDWFLSRSVGAHELLTHSEQYASLGVPVIRYEELRKSGFRELERLLLRWGVTPDADRIRAALTENDIDKLRVEGKKLEKLIAPEHFRRGGTGTYREELPADVIADIEWRFERVLRRWGYPIGAHTSNGP
jgi:hypothetical protein